MAPTGPAAAQAKRKGRRKKGKRRKSGGGGSGNGKAAPSAGPAATAAAAAAAQRIEEEKEQRARMVQLAKEYLQLWGMRVCVVVGHVCMYGGSGRFAFHFGPARAYGPSTYLPNHGTTQEQGSGWRFNKVRQTWVLHHLYDEGRVDSKMLKLALPYVAGLQGGAREVWVGWIWLGWVVASIIVSLIGWLDDGSV